MNKIAILLLLISLLSSCSKQDKNAQKHDSKDNNTENVQTTQQAEEISEDNIYYLNIPGNMWLQKELGGTKGKESSSNLHKRKVVVLEEKDGWKKINFPDSSWFGPFWIEDRYFVKSLDEIVPDYEFIKKAVGKYYYDRVEIVKNDNNTEVPYRYDGDVITLDYEDGEDFFTIREENGNGSFRSKNECIVPNNNIDPFLVTEASGVKGTIYYDYYFTNEGMKTRTMWDRYTGLVWDVIYIKK
jgi:hypothetical protein